MESFLPIIVIAVTGWLCLRHLRAGCGWGLLNSIGTVVAVLVVWMVKSNDDSLQAKGITPVGIDWRIMLGIAWAISWAVSAARSE